MSPMKKTTCDREHSCSSNSLPVVHEDMEPGAKRFDIHPGRIPARYFAKFMFTAACMANNEIHRLLGAEVSFTYHRVKNILSK